MKTFKLSRDPNFVAKVEEIVGLLFSKVARAKQALESQH